MKKLVLLILLVLINFNIHSQNVDPLIKLDSRAQERWVDSIMKSLTLEQKIGQLFMVPAYSNKDVKHEAAIDRLINKYGVGGLVFFQGTPQKQAQMTNRFQKRSKVPLLIGFDGEWGLNMRLNDTYRFPWNMTLGAVQDPKLIESFGKHVGRHARRLGIHVNFAPVVDVNINPKNPIIGNRSFGEDPENVTQKAMSFIRGLQSEQVLANAKHFPGHGDTDADSHETLPTIPFTNERLDSIELYPYKRLFDTGLASVMVAHLSIPALEPNTDLPSSLSKNIVTDLLQKDLGFEGLIITDALNMKGASNFSTSAEINLEVIKAGNDILLMPNDIEGSFKKIKEAISDGDLTEARINNSVRKILKAKYWAGLYQKKPIIEDRLLDDLNTVYDDVLHQELARNSITLIKNSNSLYPIDDLVQNKIAYVKLGDADNSKFIERLNDYTQVDVISGDKLDVVIKKLKPYNVVVIGYHKSNANPWKDFKFKNKELVWLQEIARKKRVILDIFASPYSLLDIKTFTNLETIVVSYQNSEMAQDVSAQLLFGAGQTKGKLPVSINNNFKSGHGYVSKDLRRLTYGFPERVGLSSEKLKRVDSIAQVILDEKMAPGMQVLIARKGHVVYRKSFGYHTAEKRKPVKNTDIYDLASITKILGGIPSIMKAYEDEKFSLDSKLGDLLPYLKNTDKDSITVRKALSHNGRLKAWIPYYIYTLDSITKKPLKEFYNVRKTKKFGIQVAENLYLRTSFKDSIFKMITDSPLRERNDYKYSGLIFYLFKDYIERQYRKELNEFNDTHFYKPLGATTLTYNPLNKFSRDRIVPTEIDKFYRKQLLHGYVHDQGAAMLNGVNGNAGLFANSNDIAKMMQLYLQEGFYGGKQYFKKETIHNFTKRHFEKDSVRRGLGFDKPQIDPEIKATCGCVSPKSFGHSGYTGTYVWADPQTKLIYVFLSNRVYPTAANDKLVKENMRTEVQRLVQDALIE
ncbi:MAG: serine hydrolase [Flavobacteriaceae bacterium]|nr:serine hydrolase [Flavobacteriaceae bacterium]